MAYNNNLHGNIRHGVVVFDFQGVPIRVAQSDVLGRGDNVVSGSRNGSFRGRGTIL